MIKEHLGLADDIVTTRYLWYTVSHQCLNSVNAVSLLSIRIQHTFAGLVANYGISNTIVSPFCRNTCMFAINVTPIRVLVLIDLAGFQSHRVEINLSCYTSHVWGYMTRCWKKAWSAHSNIINTNPGKCTSLCFAWWGWRLPQGTMFILVFVNVHGQWQSNYPHGIAPKECWLFFKCKRVIRVTLLNFCGLGAPYDVAENGHRWFRQWLGAYSALSH